MTASSTSETNFKLSPCANISPVSGGRSLSEDTAPMLHARMEPRASKRRSAPTSWHSPLAFRSDSMRGFHSVRTPFRAGAPLRAGRQNGCKVQALFRFGKNGADSKEAGIYGNLSRDDFDKIEMEQYFNYTGRLATEQTYDTFNEYVESGAHPCDVILVWAAEEGDLPKVEEVLAAGADPTFKDLKGRTALELAADEEIRDALKAASAAAA